jgi:saccharopine dehydrogenase-like NADP-dependent oxidoreductase
LNEDSEIKMSTTPSKTLVLGAGLVGRIIALDLAADVGREVTVVDMDDARLQAVTDHGGLLKAHKADCADADAIGALCASHELVVGALPSRLGLQTLETVIRSGRPFCDISFMAEDARVLSDLAVKHGVTAVVDCGVAPGMSNLLAGEAVRRLSPCRSITIRVGGLPVDRSGPWGYKAPFSPYDVIEEYLRPARLVRSGSIVTRDALTEPVTIDYPHVGLLEGFNTDGLRSLADTLDVPEMTEQTLRYPGYRDAIVLLRESGLLDETPIEVDGVMVTPRSLTCAKLFPLWTYAPGEADLTFMRVEAEGDLDGVATHVQWDLYDEFDPASGYLSMARTTGFPATIMARAIESGMVCRPGVHPPELLADIPGLLAHLFECMATRGVHYTYTQTQGKPPAAN